MKTSEDVYVKMCSMPCTIRGFVRKNPDMTYTIVINDRLNTEMQRRCYRHELKHIDNGDFDKECSVDLIEAEAHK